MRSAALCAAVGWGLPARALVDLMEGGPHLLAPTGSDLGRFGRLGTVLAGYHRWVSEQRWQVPGREVCEVV